MDNETRKCSICKSFIYINSNIDSFVISENQYVHIDCFINKKMNLKRGAWTIEKCNSVISELKENTEKEVHSRTIRRKVTDWIFSTYEVSYMPNYFYTKLDEIYKGTYKGLNVPISPDDLLDMWQRKINYLEKVSIRNKSLGKAMDKNNRINYDLAIVLSKYDSYLEWKKEQEIQKIEIEKNVQNKTNAIDYNNLGKKQDKIDNTININDILDEI